MARNLKNLTSGNKAKQAMLQNNVVPPYTPPDPVIPQVTAPAPIAIFQGDLKEGMDYGAIKVENGKLVVDMNDFLPDYGLYDSDG